ncbi:MAG: DUF349 domain-containing protein [Bacteroidales bacterium]|nr:DUF349 domain-containing protein [Bacteroidales bacterium]
MKNIEKHDHFNDDSASEKKEKDKESRPEENEKKEIEYQPESKGKDADSVQDFDDSKNASEEDLEGNSASRDIDPGDKEDENSDKGSRDDDKVNYELLSKEDLVKLLEDLLNKKTIEELKNIVNEIQEIFEKKHEAELAEKKKNFLESGGLEQDFKPVEDPVSSKMNELLEKYKSIKAEYNKQLEATKEENLAKKQDILEQFRILMEGPEGFEKTYRKFKHLQKSWFDIGVVPKQHVKDLWNSYNFFVEKFNDYVGINKELRVLDHKKNLDLKIKLCEKAEELAREKNIPAAFKRLQKYHSQWREIGPVPGEDKDAIWKRFSAATSVINKAHQNYQSELKESLVKNLQMKADLCEKAEALSELDLNNHKEWVEKTNELLAMQKEWKAIGFAPKKDNNLIYSRFRKACDKFFDKKAAFYTKTYETQKESLTKKKEIVEEAESLQDNTDWKKTTEKLIDLQKRWKKTGPALRKDSEKLWKRFRAACDHFFNKKSDYYSGQDELFEENLKARQKLINKIEKYKPKEKQAEFIELLESFQETFNEIGFVPIEQKDTIRRDFKNAVDKLIDRSDFSKIDRSIIRYRLKIKGLINIPRADNKLHFERERLVNKLQQLKNDIGLWENNIGFIKQTESSEDTISGFQDKIDDARYRIELLEKKIAIIDEADLNT